MEGDTAERRIDPGDGRAYTYEELAAWYSCGGYRRAEVDSYWAGLEPGTVATPGSADRWRPCAPGGEGVSSGASAAPAPERWTHCQCRRSGRGGRGPCSRMVRVDYEEGQPFLCAFCGGDGDGCTCMCPTCYDYRANWPVVAASVPGSPVPRAEAETQRQASFQSLVDFMGALSRGEPPPPPVATGRLESPAASPQDEESQYCCTECKRTIDAGSGWYKRCGCGRWPRRTVAAATRTSALCVG